MPRKKRSEKLAEVAVKPARKPVVTGVVAQRTIGCFCPVCGRTISQFRAIKVGYVTVDQLRYFESIDWDPSKPFGISFAAGGRGSLQDWAYISPEDAPELFEALKGRFLDALGEWLTKGWIKHEELP